MQKLKKVLLTFFLLLFFFSLNSCISIQKTYGTGEGLKRLYDWKILQLKIFSWQDQSADALVKEWGIPQREYTYNNGEKELVYQTSRVTVSSTSQLYDDYYTMNATAKTDENTITFTVKGDTINRISYSGTYNDLSKICKKQSPTYYTNPEVLVFIIESNNYINNLDKQNWRYKSTEEIIKLEELISEKWEESPDSRKSVYETEYNAIRELYAKASKSKFENHLDITESNITMDSISTYIISVIVYREMYENASPEIREKFFEQNIFSQDYINQILEEYKSNKKSWRTVSRDEINDLRKYCCTNDEVYNQVYTKFREQVTKDSSEDTICQRIDDIEKNLDLINLLDFIVSINIYYDIVKQ